MTIDLKKLIALSDEELRAEYERVASQRIVDVYLAIQLENEMERRQRVAKVVTQ